MKNERRAMEALEAYGRLVEILEDEGWTNREPAELEARLGRPVVSGRTFNAFGDAYAAFGDAIVDSIAHALDAGVSQKDLVECRGWLSHNDIRGYLERARRPYNHHPEHGWAQYQAFAAACRGLEVMREADPASAESFQRATRSYFRRWARQIPEVPSESYLAVFAPRWRDEHIAIWVKGRTKLLKDIDQLGTPKDRA